jgi:hypothetical protein
MYAVIVDQAIYYIGENRDAAMKVLDSKKGGGTITSVYSLSDLKGAFDFHLADTEHSSRLDEVLKRLDEINLAGEAEEVAKTVRENSEKAIGQVRSLGLRGIKGLGEGFTALGDLLQKAGEEDTNKEEQNE